MKKKFTLEIENPCSENFDKMIPNAGGSFCSSCAKNVIDLSKKTNSEVAKLILENKDKNICARLKRTQLEQEFQYNEISKINNLKYAAVAASILLASNVSGQEKEAVKTEISTDSSRYLVGKVAQVQTVDQNFSIVIKGQLLNTKTNKLFRGVRFPDLIIVINGVQSTIKFNAKYCEFSVPLQVLKNTKTLEVTITSGDYHLSKTIPFNSKEIKKGILEQNISIDEEEFSIREVMILGGLGINYLPEKKDKKNG